MRSAIVLAGAGWLAIGGCTAEREPDAYGNVEATEVVVGAETTGQLLRFTVREGERLAAGVLVAVIDTTQLALEREELAARRAASLSRVDRVGREIDALEVEREIARRGYERTRRLFAEEAATAMQRDQAEREVRVLGERIEAARAERRAAEQELASADAHVARIGDRIRQSRIRNPSAGTVLANYAEVGEIVQAGQPLYRIADLDTMEVRAYITETQLAGITVGQTAGVSVDVGPDERRVLSGTVIWISPEAEFAPTPIQTREERADLVYAVRIRVPNPAGILKIGMPADVRFAGTIASG